MPMELVLRFGYGATVPWVHRLKDGTLRAIGGPDQVVLRTPAPIHGEDAKIVAEFTLAAGETVPFVLTYAPSHLPILEPVDPTATLDTTERFSTEWSGRARIEEGGQRDTVTVMRSLITLKALTHAPTDGVVTAPTTSLPETLGGSRNRDNRFCWLNDAILALLALMNAGYYEEGGALRGWLLRAVAGVSAQASIKYGTTGEHRSPEWEVDWLPDYADAKPKRIGNGSHRQIQIDVYDEVMDGLYQAQRGGLASSGDAWALQQAFMTHPADVRREPNRAIWESRQPPRHFTFSKVMVRVALDRAVKLVMEFDLPGPVERWRDIAQAIHDDICANCDDAELSSSVQYDVRSKRLVGNVPQIFSHSALVNTAHNRARSDKLARQRTDEGAPPRPSPAATASSPAKAR